MPQFFISTDGGAYCLVEGDSTDSIARHLALCRDRGVMASFDRPDGREALIEPAAVVLIQPPAPAAFKHTNHKEQ
jgi:hypothetical protein